MGVPLIECLCCNPYANRNFGLNMTQLQLYLFLVAVIYLISCIDNKQKSRTPDENALLCLINKHIMKYHEQGYFLKALLKIKGAKRRGADGKAF